MPIDPHDDARLEGVSIRSLPKISLHDHLDGAVRPETMVELADEAGIILPVSDADGLSDWIAEQSGSGSLVEFLRPFDVVTGVLQSASALRRVAREYVEDLAADGVIYGEARWAPEQHLARGLTPEDAVDAVQQGIEEGEDAAAEAGHDIRVGQILAAMRQGASSARIARLAVAFRDGGVIGFDLAGPEDGFPPAAHREALDHLADEFFPVTIHAGEAAGLESIRSALIDGRALRLGHGVRIAQDIDVVSRSGDTVEVVFGDLARWVRDREIPLELSVTSNLLTGAVTAWGDEVADHPFDLLYQLGFAVTVNTDDRTMCRTSLTRELALLAETFDYSLDDLERFQLNAAAGAFLPVEEREELIDLISDGFAL